MKNNLSKTEIKHLNKLSWMMEIIKKEKKKQSKSSPKK